MLKEHEKSSDARWFASVGEEKGGYTLGVYDSHRCRMGAFVGITSVKLQSD